MNFCFPQIWASIHWSFKILVPFPHNIPLIMLGRHKNFKDPINRGWDISKTKIQNGGYYLHTLYLGHFPLCACGLTFHKSYCYQQIFGDEHVPTESLKEKVLGIITHLHGMSSILVGITAWDDILRKSLDLIMKNHLNYALPFLVH